MSEVIYSNGDLTVGTLDGGGNWGKCLQITTPDGYILLTYADAEAVANAILRELDHFHGTTE